ncbi:succinylglutamate desuccinylase [Vreelandella malpeensis]|uniref:Succinylglutamate desuccinylase n=1 Tax=Vreelandella malpeensis TaxID=1172368 RepID=A0ABS8DMT3_9GAMM|nr:succinylglutamate desuccinylase [Halomonas malpeensis]MCB8887586.1 succinylglutamate desuccinylase [Halomonas malpeensis]
MLGQWLDWTLDDQTPSLREGRLEGGRYHLRAPGVLELVPDQIGENAHACIFSAALHGNETAPVELLGQWLCALEAGTQRLGAPVLVILGNIPALKAQTRFVTTNLNRLFFRELDRAGDEPDRARALMAEVDAFFERHAPLPRLHYDLHTAIRQSLYPRFVVEPFSDTPTEARQWAWLAGADMQAVLHQHQHSHTFSHYSRHYHGAQAFTFELGRVAPFGHNDLAALAPMLSLITTLGAGELPASSSTAPLAFFRVEHELLRSCEDFTLCFAEDVANFTPFAPGTRLARDAQAGDFVVGETPLRVVFPNARVEIGARAALLVSPVEK